MSVSDSLSNVSKFSWLSNIFITRRTNTVRYFRSGKWIKNIIHILYVVFFVGVLIATILVDRYNSQNTFQNEVRWANGGYYLFAVIFLGIISFLYSNKQRQEISDKKYYILLMVIVSITLFIQTAVALWAPVLAGGGDFASVHDMAINLAQGGDFEGDTYFAVHSNNRGIAILLSLVYRIANSWRFVIWTGAFVTNLSVIMMAIVIKKITDNKIVSLVLCFVGEVLIALSWRSFMPYTDNFAMLFVAAIMLVTVLEFESEVKIPIIIFLGIIGGMIKITAIIPLIAFFIYIVLISDAPEFIKLFIEDCKVGKLANYKRHIVSFLIFCILLLAIKNTALIMDNKYKIEQSNDARGWQFMLMVGQAFDNTGQVGGADYDLKWKEILSEYSDRSDRLDACLKQAIFWVKDRKILGNIKFYIKKLNVAFNDGGFHNVQPYNHEEVLRNVVYEFYSNDGKYYVIIAELRQILWDMVIVLLSLPIVIYIFKRKTMNVYIFFECSIIGVITYLCLLEGRSKYLYMFLPLFLAYAGVMMDRMLKGMKFFSKLLKTEGQA